jgi:hypothetical protein
MSTTTTELYSSTSNASGDSDGDIRKYTVKPLHNFELPVEGSLSLPYKLLTHQNEVTLWEINSDIYFLIKTDVSVDSFWHLLSIDKDNQGCNKVLAVYKVIMECVDPEDWAFLDLSTVDKVGMLYEMYQLGTDLWGDLK